jgi:hypothetical protein
MLVPGEAPVEKLANSAARAKPDCREARSELEEPMAENEVIKGATADTPATVVTSLRTMKVLVPRVSQAPRAASRARLGLLPLGVPPAVSLGLPPVATR